MQMFTRYDGVYDMREPETCAVATPSEGILRREQHVGETNRYESYSSALGAIFTEGIMLKHPKSGIPNFPAHNSWASSSRATGGADGRVVGCTSRAGG